MPNYERLSPKIERVIINNPNADQQLEWINITNAGKKEIEYLRKAYDFNISHLRASVATVFSQRPMLLNEDLYLFLILHFPVFQHQHIAAAEVEFFVGHGYLITLHNGNLPALDKFFSFVKKAPQDLDSYTAPSSAILLAELLNRLIQESYTIIDDNLTAIDVAEDTIFAHEQKKAVAMILNLRHNIINVRRIFQNHRSILQKLMSVSSSIVPTEEIQGHYELLVEHSKDIWEMLDNQKEMVEALNSTNESFLNARMTSIMKTLTMISALVMPMTLIAGIFTMRTFYMPLERDPRGFWLILLIMVLSCLVMGFYFMRKKWLK